MSIDKKPEDQITEAGAVELEESQLDDVAGGVIAIAPVAAEPPDPGKAVSGAPPDPIRTSTQLKF